MALSVGFGLGKVVMGQVLFHVLHLSSVSVSPPVLHYFMHLYQQCCVISAIHSIV